MSQNTCVRCGKPCAAGEIMCPECNQWFQEQTKGASGSVKKAPRPVSRPTRQPTPQPASQPAPAPVSQPVQEPVKEAQPQQPVRQTPVGANQKNCAGCGKAMPAISRFCPHCGCDQNNPGAVPAPSAARKQPAQSAPQRAPRQSAPQEPVKQPEPQQPTRQQPQPAAPASSVSGSGVHEIPDADTIIIRHDGAAVAREEKANKVKILILALLAVIFVVAYVIVSIILAKNGGEFPTKKDKEQLSASEEAANTGTAEEENGVFVPEFEFEDSSDELIATDPDVGTGTALPAVGDEQEETTEAVIACVKCGVAIPANAQFCPYCGHDQTQPAEEIPEEITATLHTTAVQTNVGTLKVVGTNQSSVVSQSGTHNNTAEVIADGDLATSWQEGVNGDGIDEWVYLDLNGMNQIQYLRFYLGNWRNADWYAKNNVPKELEISIGGETFNLEFPYNRQEYWVEFSTPIRASDVTITIKSVYEGSQYDDTCIAEIMIYGEAE